MDVDPDQEMDVSQGQATNKAEDNKDEERDGDGDDSEDASSAEDDSDEVAPADDDALDETSGGSRHYGARKCAKQATSVCSDELLGRAEDKSDSAAESDPARRPPGNHVKVEVHVDLPQTWHANWDAWLEYLEVYQAKTHQMLRIREVLTNKTKNERVLKTKRGSSGAGVVPTELDPYFRVYICTHGWKPRKSRTAGKAGKRARRQVRTTECPLRFVVQWCEQGTGWNLRVQNGVWVHNHPVGHATFRTYPEQRGVGNPNLQDHVNGMLSACARRRKIYAFLVSNDQSIIKRDVDNLVQKHAAGDSSMDEDDAVASGLGAFAAADPENLISVDETPTGKTGVISLTSKHMRRMYYRFSEFLMIDCTHKTNR